MDALEVFAANLRRERTAQGLSQERLAELAGLYMTDIGRIERAERDPGVRTIAKLAAGLGLATDRLFLADLPDSMPSDDAPG
jgi:transcriptional regulator with XRE-family HTH domain